MDRKLICFDLDGTLLNKDRKVPLSSYIAIEKLMAQGHEVSIATGRMYKSAFKISKLLPDGVNIICSNGSVIAKGNNILFKDTIPETDLEPLYKITQDAGLGLTFVSLYAAYHTHISDTIKYHYFMNRYLKDHFIKSLHLRNEDEFRDHMKFFINGIVITRRHPERLKELRTQLESLGRYNIESSSSNNLEIIPIASDKGKGALRLGQILGIDKKDIIAFGDAENDLKMIKCAGLGVAMGNAPEFVLSCADMVTDSNENDGIVKALRTIFNNSSL